MFSHRSSDPEMLVATHLSQALFDLVDDVIELCVGLALAVPHCQLAVNQHTIRADLKRTRATLVLARGDLNVGTKLGFEKAGERGDEAGVPSPATVLDVHSYCHYGRNDWRYAHGSVGTRKVLVQCDISLM